MESNLIFVKFPMAVDDELILVFTLRKIDNCVEVLFTGDK